MQAAKQISFTIFITFILIITIALGISGTVVSKEQKYQASATKYYRALEQEYVKELREVLGENGYPCSGVTMTEVIEADGKRSYTVMIHHQKINVLSTEEKETLLTKCSSIYFGDNTCSISHKFLGKDL